jgi:hypothetical protein
MDIGFAIALIMSTASTMGYVIASLPPNQA